MERRKPPRALSPVTEHQTVREGYRQTTVIAPKGRGQTPEQGYLTFLKGQWTGYGEAREGYEGVGKGPKRILLTGHFLWCQTALVEGVVVLKLAKAMSRDCPKPLSMLVWTLLTVELASHARRTPSNREFSTISTANRGVGPRDAVSTTKSDSLTFPRRTGGAVLSGLSSMKLTSSRLTSEVGIRSWTSRVEPVDVRYVLPSLWRESFPPPGCRR